MLGDVSDDSLSFSFSHINSKPEALEIGSNYLTPALLLCTDLHNVRGQDQSPYISKTARLIMHLSTKNKNIHPPPCLRSQNCSRSPH
jgi:hypothetical protein